VPDLVRQVQAVETYRTVELGDVLEIALRSRPGGGSEWDGLLNHLGLVPSSSTQRAARVRALELKAGALPSEVRMAIHIIASTAEAQLERLERKWPEALKDAHPSAGRIRVLRAGLVGLVEREGAAYDAKVRPESKSAHLGAIFANVRATKGLRPWENIEWRRSLTIQCPGCGAPQEVAAQFTCAFCTGDLLGRRDLFKEYAQ
jgi:hypothetical protein